MILCHALWHRLGDVLSKSINFSVLQHGFIIFFLYLFNEITLMVALMKKCNKVEEADFSLSGLLDNSLESYINI